MKITSYNHMREKLKELKDQANMTSAQLANELEVSTSAVEKWMSGQREMSFNVIQMMLSVFERHIEMKKDRTNESTV